MSETQERETEIVAGTIGGITQKKADTWTIQVTPKGSQYAKNLWTKDVELVEALASKIGQHGSFVGGLGAPYTVNGKEVRSWWIQSADDEPRLDDLHISTRSEATPVTAPKAGEQLSKDEWARKDSAAWKRMLIETAADALKHTIPSDPTSEDLGKFIARVSILTLAWHSSVLAERDDPAGEDVPF